LIIDKETGRRVTLLWIAFSFFAAHLCFFLLPNVFVPWQEQTSDYLLKVKADSAAFRLPYDDTIVLIDIDNTSLDTLGTYYLNRSHHARVIRNLAAMDASVQMYDFIFGGRRHPEEDAELIRATRNAGNVYIGMAFQLDFSHTGMQTADADPHNNRFLQQTGWPVTVKWKKERFYTGRHALVTFLPLSEAARGTGYLNLKPDSDGVFRRLPLLVHYGSAYYPSFSLQVACDYLDVPAENVVIQPRRIVLRNARLPNRSTRTDIRIPIDRHGNMRINFTGPWGRMKHYHFSDVYSASDDPGELALWREELSGKIVLVSDVSTGSTDVGQVPTDPDFPLSGIHANSLHTILTRSFLQEPSDWMVLLIELLLLIAVALLSFHRSAVFFTLGTLGVAGVYFCLAGLLVFKLNILLPIIRPLLMVFFALITLHIVSAVKNAHIHAATQRAREVAERDLEIGRKIQSGFFPSTLPSPAGWEINATFQPARQVAGDFYDLFWLDGDNAIGIVIADVCDKGVGAALFMALTRSLIRAFSIQDFGRSGSWQDAQGKRQAASLLNTIRQTNNYIANTHGDTGMFATLFLGALDTQTGVLTYINCGHEPPMVLCREEISERLKPTGPALGMMPDLEYQVDRIRLQPGETFFAFTDGLTDAQDPSGELFGRNRLEEVLRTQAADAKTLIDGIVRAVAQHIAGADPFDDLTLVVVRRKPDKYR
jgi:serine phosphatase RsbU (regulator of sigma subunit)/CHASE2 domain-containing sensor protein